MLNSSKKDNNFKNTNENMNHNNVIKEKESNLVSMLNK